MNGADIGSDRLFSEIIILDVSIFYSCSDELDRKWFFEFQSAAFEKNFRSCIHTVTCVFHPLVSIAVQKNPGLIFKDPTHPLAQPIMVGNTI